MRGRVPILILNWNGWNDTMQCVASVYADHTSHKVWVADNASIEDRSPELLARWPNLRLIKNAENLGYAGGCNKGLQIAIHENVPYVYLLNNDAIVERGFLSNVLQVAEADPKIGAVGSLIVSSDGAKVQYDGRYYWEDAMPDRESAGGSRDVADACGAGLLLNMEALKTVGLFDERFFCYYEERDLCWRLRERGWGVSYARRSVVRHKIGASDTNANQKYYLARNSILLIQNHTPGNMRPREVRRAIGETMLAALRQSRAVRQAMLWAIQDGLAGCYGQRPTHRERGLIARPAWHLYMFARYLERKVRARERFSGLMRRMPKFGRERNAK